MQLKKKNLVFEIKQENINEEQGIVFGYASTSDIDLDGDIILPFAFQESINEWKQNPNSIKFLSQHDNKQIIGEIIELYYNEDGSKLNAKMQFFINDIECAKEAFFLAKKSLLSFSVGFYDAKYKYDDKNSIRNIYYAKLYEISAVSFPANTNAIILGTKNKLQEFILKLQESELLEKINNLKSFEDYQILCEEELNMPRKIRKAFKVFLEKQIANEVETKTEQIKKEFQKASDTSEPAPSDTSKVVDDKSNEITEKILKTLNIN